MDFEEAERYILGFTDYEKLPGIAYTQDNYDLRRMEALLRLLGNPHLPVSPVHVAGTKGKGSTAAMIASVLTMAGHRTGLYTSPHFSSIRERIRVDSELITESDFALITELIYPSVEKVNKERLFGQLTTFEILTALALTYFGQKKAAFTVLEAGLGGRLDATNVVRPVVSVITSISLDHTEILGKTPVLIAAEKSGIIKQATPVVMAPQVYEDAAAVVREKCLKLKAPLTEVGRDITYKKIKSDRYGQEIEVKGKLADYQVKIPLLGDHQVENAATALGALEIITGKGVSISEADIRTGFERVKWEGRLQILGSRPLLVVDGAHNDYSMRRLLSAVRENFRYADARVVFGSSLDKDIRGMARELAAFGATVTVTRSSHPRAAETRVLSDTFTTEGVKVEDGGSVAEDLDKLMSTVSEDTLILVTGSLFVVGEAIAWASGRHLS